MLDTLKLSLAVLAMAVGAVLVIALGWLFTSYAFALDCGMI
jgi:hypothetical protein